MSDQALMSASDRLLELAALLEGAELERPTFLSVTLTCLDTTVQLGIADFKARAGARHVSHVDSEINRHYEFEADGVRWVACVGLWAVDSLKAVL